MVTEMSESDGKALKSKEKALKVDGYAVRVDGNKLIGTAVEW